MEELNFTDEGLITHMNRQDPRDIYGQDKIDELRADPFSADISRSLAPDQFASTSLEQWQQGLVSDTREKASEL